MDLWCNLCCLSSGDKMIILPNEVELQSLDLFINDESKNDKIKIQENQQKTDPNTETIADKVFEITKIALFSQQNIEKIQNTNQYSIGLKDQSLNIGPILRTIYRSTYAELNSNQIVFFDKNPLNSKRKYVEESHSTQLGITPGNDENNDLLILVINNGCVIVRSGGYLICDFPIVVVKPNGNYSTIGCGPRNKIQLKGGTHLAFFVKLGIPVPILFLRRDLQTVKQIKANEENSNK